MQIMDQLEIYIPVEAEVKNIPLRSLSSSVLRRMGFSEPEGSGRLSDSPWGVWIYPALLRKKGRKHPIQNMSSLLNRAAPGPFQMSFSTNNRMAYKLLAGTMPGKTLSAELPHSTLPLQIRAPGTNKAAVVIYNRQIYLFSRRPNHREAQQASHTSSPPKPESAAKRQRMALLEPADKQQLKKKLHVALPQDSLKKLKDIMTKKRSSTTDQELSRPLKKQTTCSALQSEVSTVSSSRPAAPPVLDPQSSDSLHTEDTYQAAEGPLQAAEAPAWFQSQGNSEIQDLGGDQEADYIHSDSVEPDHVQTWTGSRSQGAAGASTSLQEQCDFKELEEEEEISRIKAKLRQMEGRS